jgi:hypothetical protein
MIRYLVYVKIYEFVINFVGSEFVFSQVGSGMIRIRRQMQDRL